MHQSPKSGLPHGDARRDEDPDGMLCAAYREASEVERSIWASVVGKHPGQPGHDPKAWEEWSRAATRVQALGRLMRARRPPG